MAVVCLPLRMAWAGASHDVQAHQAPVHGGAGKRHVPAKVVTKARAGDGGSGAVSTGVPIRRNKGRGLALKAHVSGPPLVKVGRKTQAGDTRNQVGTQAGVSAKKVMRPVMAHQAAPILGPWLRPVAGRLVRHWGEVTDAGPANGATYRAKGAAAVRAPCAGQVEFSGPFRSYGQLVIVDCGQGYRLVLAGMDRLSVSPGQKLRRGASIGWLPGQDPELYVELRKGEQAIDPALLLIGTSSKEKNTPGA